MQIPLWILLAMSIGFGLDTELTAGTAHRAALWLLGSTP
jgi:hypothetical protein